MLDNKLVDKPEKPELSLFEVWQKTRKIQNIEMDLDMTNADYDENCNELNGFAYTKWMRVTGPDGQSSIINEYQFEEWYDFKGDKNCLWTMKYNFHRQCKSWEEFLANEDKEFQLYQKLKEKFE